MKVRAFVGAAFLFTVITGCNQMPGTPKPGVEVPRPDAITDFATLYRQNCSGCHGNDGQGGAALDLSNPVYQSWIDDASLRKIIAEGEHGTQMPAFGRSAGGELTDEQLDALVHGMRTAWQKGSGSNGQTPPPYQSTAQGDASRGKPLYQSGCARCHDQPGKKIVDGTYLALVSDQALRTIIVAGRPDLNHPNWQGYIAGHPLTDQEVADIVAWLGSQRSLTPGQPYPQ